MISPQKLFLFMENYKTTYKDYTKSVAIMVSTDRQIFLEKSAVRARMVEYSKLYKELHIIIFSSKRFESKEISSNCTIYSTNSFVSWNYVSDGCRVGNKILKSIDKDESILVTCQDPFETALVGKYISNMRRNSELLLQIHTDLFSPYFTSKNIGIKNAIFNKIRLFISKFTLPHAQVIRVVSRKIADSLVKKGIDQDKIIIKPIEVNTDYIRDTQPSFNLKQRFPHYKKIILLVSRLESEKNVSMALQSMKILNSKIPDIGLVILGSGSEMPRLKKQAYRLKIEASVAFMGWQTDLIPYYKGCDVFLNISWFEGYGMTLVEAKSAGCKIVSTDVGIARETGAIIVDWKAEDIADKLMKVLI